MMEEVLGLKRLDILRIVVNAIGIHEQITKWQELHNITGIKDAINTSAHSAHLYHG